MPRSQHAARQHGRPAAVAEVARAIWHCDLEGPIKSAADFAREMNCDVARVAKTILLVAESLSWQGQRLGEKHCVCVVLSSPAKVDLAAVSEQLTADDLRLATASEVQSLLGVKPGAVSPFVGGTIPVLVDSALLDHQTIFVSGGEPGLDLEIAPDKLLDVVAGCSGRFATGSP